MESGSYIPLIALLVALLGGGGIIGLLVHYRNRRRVRITYRIQHDLVGRMHFHQVPLRIWVTNQTERTIFRENTYIDLPDGQVRPHNIYHESSESSDTDQWSSRRMQPGDTIVIVYEMMYLSELLVRRWYSGRAKVKFVFAYGEKDQEKWIQIEPNVEYWSRPAIIEEAKRSRGST